MAFGCFILEQVGSSLILVGDQRILMLSHFERRSSEQIKRGFYVGKFTTICSPEVEVNVLSYIERVMRCW